MSYSILEALFYGKIIPWERKSTNTHERKELGEKIENERQYFVERMSFDDCQRFEKMFSLFMQVNYEEEIDIYLHGFTLGSLIMMEIMEKKGDIINE